MPVCRRAASRASAKAKAISSASKLVDNNRPRNSSAVWRNSFIPQAGQPLFLVLGPLNKPFELRSLKSGKQVRRNAAPCIQQQSVQPIFSVIGSFDVRCPGRKESWERWVVVDARLSCSDLRPEAGIARAASPAAKSVVQLAPNDNRSAHMRGCRMRPLARHRAAARYPLEKRAGEFLCLAGRGDRPEGRRRPSRPKPYLARSSRPAGTSRMMRAGRVSSRRSVSLTIVLRSRSRTRSISSCRIVARTMREPGGRTYPISWPS